MENKVEKAVEMVASGVRDRDFHERLNVSDFMKMNGEQFLSYWNDYAELMTGDISEKIF